ncbi:LysR substrate-binding domain-containing protein [Dactylosporangium sp. CA-092794]|uniref:LysR substrate-binding domain-containing protein n=1 Tax=Dactylosporangium sp. CA-092794 TaxID=3239929 RepID=UPI003D8A9B94
MDVRQLRYFTVLAEECHFGRAAARLHLAQPALSQQIRQLERELGGPLFIRSTRRVELTDAGTLLLARARTILALLARAEDEQTRLAQGHLGRVAIGFIGTATYHSLPGVARQVRRELPGLQLDLRGEMLSPDLLAALLDHIVDIAVTRPPADPAGLRITPLRSEPLIAALRADDPRAAADTVDLTTLAGDPFIAHPSGQRSSMYQCMIDTCRAAGFHPAEVIEVRETSTLVTFVAAGLGVALLPESVRALRIDGVAYRPLATPSIPVELVIATRAEPPAPAVALVAGIVETCIRAGLPGARP